MIPFSRITWGEEEKAAIARVMDTGWWAAGPETTAFEQEFSAYISPPGENYYCIFTNSCTSALKMAYKWVLDEYHPLDFRSLAMPRNTFCATYAAADEVFGDNEYVSWDFEGAEYTPSYAERVNLHYGGVKDETPCLIEDSAHRIEANDPLVGKIRCYSFYATKNMTTGSGGMLVTNDKEIYETCRLYWKDGLTSSTADRDKDHTLYRVKAYAGGYDGNDLAAALGRVQLQKLPLFTQQRNAKRDTYNAAFGQDWQGNHLYPYFCRSVDEVAALQAFLKEAGIQTSYHYPTEDGQYRPDWLAVSLPIYPNLDNNEVTCIIDAIHTFKL